MATDLVIGYCDNKDIRAVNLARSQTYFEEFILMLPLQNEKNNLGCTSTRKVEKGDGRVEVEKEGRVSRRSFVAGPQRFHERRVCLFGAHWCLGNNQIAYSKHRED